MALGEGGGGRGGCYVSQTKINRRSIVLNMIVCIPVACTVVYSK